jgi:hypothetical protein
MYVYIHTSIYKYLQIYTHVYIHMKNPLIRYRNKTNLTKKVNA